jgi:hypothetical protein
LEQVHALQRFVNDDAIRAALAENRRGPILIPVNEQQVLGTRDELPSPSNPCMNTGATDLQVASLDREVEFIQSCKGVTRPDMEGLLHERYPIGLYEVACHCQPGLPLAQLCDDYGRTAVKPRRDE